MLRTDTPGSKFFSTTIPEQRLQPLNEKVPPAYAGGTFCEFNTRSVPEPE